MVVIDSDVLLLAFAFPNDERQKLNKGFLEIIQTAQPATTIYNVMETLGSCLLIYQHSSLIGGKIGLSTHTI